MNNVAPFLFSLTIILYGILREANILETSRRLTMEGYSYIWFGFFLLLLASILEYFRRKNISKKIKKHFSLKLYICNIISFFSLAGILLCFFQLLPISSTINNIVIILLSVIFLLCGKTVYES